MPSGSDPFTLVESAATTATATGAITERNRGGYCTVEFELDVTAAATAAGDTLDVYVQTTIGGNWVDIVHFTQVLGNGSTKRYFAKVIATTAMTMFENATALAAAAVRDLLGDSYRARWVVASASAPSFTFSLKAVGVRW